MNLVSVLNPRGQYPPINFIPMAPRLNSLDDKTVYIVDIRWPYTAQFTEQLKEVLSERYSHTKFVRREKAGPYGEADTELWDEIKAQGQGAILAIGH
ncbi:MAG: hypothetical protein JXD19_12840 [Deltaproteobacteria bacterium]|nr:hypothetical protein [Deltaproteobacteria bacterium]